MNAKELLREYPDTEQYFLCSDGEAFLEEEDCQAHAKHFSRNYEIVEVPEEEPKIKLSEEFLNAMAKVKAEVFGQTETDTDPDGEDTDNGDAPEEDKGDDSEGDDLEKGDDPDNGDAPELPAPDKKTKPKKGKGA